MEIINSRQHLTLKSYSITADIQELQRIYKIYTAIQDTLFHKKSAHILQIIKLIASTTIIDMQKETSSQKALKKPSTQLPLVKTRIKIKQSRCIRKLIELKNFTMIIQLL